MERMRRLANGSARVAFFGTNELNTLRAGKWFSLECEPAKRKRKQFRLAMKQLIAYKKKHELGATKEIPERINQSTQTCDELNGDQESQTMETAITENSFFSDKKQIMNCASACMQQVNVNQHDAINKTPVIVSVTSEEFTTSFTRNGTDPGPEIEILFCGKSAVCEIQSGSNDHLRMQEENSPENDENSPENDEHKPGLMDLRSAEANYNVNCINTSFSVRIFHSTARKAVYENETALQTSFNQVVCMVACMMHREAVTNNVQLSNVQFSKRQCLSAVSPTPNHGLLVPNVQKKAVVDDNMVPADATMNNVQTSTAEFPTGQCTSAESPMPNHRLFVPTGKQETAEVDGNIEPAGATMNNVIPLKADVQYFKTLINQLASLIPNMMPAGAAINNVQTSNVRFFNGQYISDECPTPNHGLLVPSGENEK